MADIINLDAAKAARRAGDVAEIDAHLFLQSRTLEGLRVALAGLTSRDLLDFHEAVDALHEDHVGILDFALNGDAEARLSYDAATSRWRRGEASGTGVADGLASAGTHTRERAGLMACALIGQGLLSALAATSRALRAAEPKP